MMSIAKLRAFKPQFNVPYNLSFSRSIRTHRGSGNTIPPPPPPPQTPPLSEEKKPKGLFAKIKQYGPIGVGVYGSLYMGCVGGIYVALSNGVAVSSLIPIDILHPDYTSILETFGKLINHSADDMRSLLTSPNLSTSAKFALAIFINEFLDPIRILLTLGITPWIIKKRDSLKADK